MDIGASESRPGVMSGKLCCLGTRRPVAMILAVILAGWDDGDVLAQFETLTPARLAATRTLLSAPESGWEQDPVV